MYKHTVMPKVARRKWYEGQRFVWQDSVTTVDRC